MVLTEGPSLVDQENVKVRGSNAKASGKKRNKKKCKPNKLDTEENGLVKRRSTKENITSSLVYKDLDEQLPHLLKIFREALKDEKLIVNFRNDDEFLTKFLRVREYNVEKALSGLRKYQYTLEINREIIRDIRPREFVTFYDAEIVVILKGVARNGSTVVYSRGRWDPNKHTLVQLQQALLFIFETIIQSKDTQLQGISIIFDLKDLAFSHLRQLTVNEIQRLIRCGQNGVPVKVTQVHLLNYPLIFWGVYYIARGFMKEKLRRRIHFHSKLETLLKHFYPETLPIGLGGRLENEQAFNEDIVQDLLKYNAVYDGYYKLQNSQQ